MSPISPINIHLGVLKRQLSKHNYHRAVTFIWESIVELIKQLVDTNHQVRFTVLLVDRKIINNFVGGQAAVILQKSKKITRVLRKRFQQRSACVQKWRALGGDKNYSGNSLQKLNRPSSQILPGKVNIFL